MQNIVAEPSLGTAYAAPAPACYPETRIGAFDFSAATCTEPLGYGSADGQRACGDSWPGMTEDLFLFSQEDPPHFQDGLSLYAYVFSKPSMLRDPEGFCAWDVRRRPSRGTPESYEPTYHWYFHNKDTGRTIGLGPSGSGVGTAFFGPTPGRWEDKEVPYSDFDKTVLPVPDSGCDCIDKRLRPPLDPPPYCVIRHLPPLFSDPRGWPFGPLQPRCENCQTWVNLQLSSCGIPGLGSN